MPASPRARPSLGKLLALDPATRTGWATTPSDVLRMSLGSWQAPKGGQVSEADRAAYLAGELDRFLAFNDIDYALIEKPNSSPGSPKRGRKVVETELGFDVTEETGGFTGSFQAQNTLWAIHGAMIGVLGVHRITFRTIAVSSWRATMFGRGGGRMKPEQSKKRCKADLEKYHGVDVRNVDQAEAGMILLMLYRQYRRWQREDRAQANLADRPKEPDWMATVQIGDD